MNGVIFVISSPTGAGKTTLCNLVEKERDDVQRVITHTTRKPREGEKNGVDYHFVSNEEFKRMIKMGEFVEYAFVHSNFYGTSKKALVDVLNQGKFPILAIDVQGAKNIANSFDNVVNIFILPPDFDIWLERIKKDRSRDSLSVRLKTAVNELSELEFFDYCIINDSLEQSLKKLHSIIDAATSKIAFFKEDYLKLANTLKNDIKEFLGGE
ncbi:guanylate kinase [Hippea jasoniae]|uniref:guanylate kinase n=1 Tax=Hippea jasoniae TaxID=944479 RepID=UPI00055143D5|nr:guanylate kinase [Hippea jasoniae]